MLYLFAIIIGICINRIITIIILEQNKAKKILLSNMISGGVLIILCLTITLTPTSNAVDIIFFYILLAPIGLMSIWTYSKYSDSHEQ